VEIKHVTWVAVHYQTLSSDDKNNNMPHNGSIALHGSIELAIPVNPLVGLNISGLPAIQADL